MRSCFLQRDQCRERNETRSIEHGLHATRVWPWSIDALELGVQRWTKDSALYSRTSRYGIDLQRCRDGSNQSNGPLYPIRSNECAIERELALSLLRSVVSKIRTSSTLSKYFMSTDTVPLYDPQESLAISTWQRVKPPHAVAVSSAVSYMYGNEAASTPPHTDEPPPKGTIAIPRGPAYRKRSRMSRSVRGNAT